MRDQYGLEFQRKAEKKKGTFNWSMKMLRLLRNGRNSGGEGDNLNDSQQHGNIGKSFACSDSAHLFSSLGDRSYHLLQTLRIWLTDLPKATQMVTGPEPTRVRKSGPW